MRSVECSRLQFKYTYTPALHSESLLFGPTDSSESILVARWATLLGAILDLDRRPKENGGMLTSTCSGLPDLEFVIVVALPWNCSTDYPN